MQFLACKALLLAFSFLAPLGSQVSLGAAELVMFKQDYCDWCEAWDNEIGQYYSVTEEGKLVPLRSVDIDSKRPEDLSHLKNITHTPTFILMQEGEEIGRIIGYPGESNFYWLLNKLIQKLEKIESYLEH